MKIRTIKKLRYQKWLASHPQSVMQKFTAEEQAWLDVIPVGREFGSVDYDRLMAEDVAKIQK